MSGRTEDMVHVFINYRRSDTRHVAGRLRDLIVARFGEDSVFVDVESIEPGLDYVAAIDQAVGSCEVMLVLIGDTWVLPVDDQGHRRIDDVADRLRLEVEAGLRHETRVIPVLVDTATMPKTRELPESLVPLSRHQATRLRHDSFRSDADHLLDVIDRAAHAPSDPLGAPRPARRTAVPDATSSGVAGMTRSTLRWVTVAVLAVAVLVLLGARSGLHDSVLESRPNLPADGPWVSLLWLLPVPVVIVAACLVAVDRRLGIALGCAASAAIWVVTSLVFVEWNSDGSGSGVHWLLVVLLAVAVVGVVLADPALGEVGRPNRADRMLVSGVLLLLAVVLRTESTPFAEVVTGQDQGALRWTGPLHAPTVWLSVLVPVLICLPAVLMRCNRTQVSALVTLAWLQIAYPVVARGLLVSAAVDSSGAAFVVAEDIVYLAGCVFVLAAVRAGQPRARRT